MANYIVNEFTEGDTPTWGFTVYTDTTKTTVRDTTDWKVWVTFKTSQDDTDANASLQVEGTVNASDGAEGLVAVRPTKEQSALLVAGRYFYDVQVYTSDEILWTVENDKIKVNKGVTKAIS